jgi:hypothetical protein
MKLIRFLDCDRSEQIRYFGTNGNKNPEIGAESPEKSPKIRSANVLLRCIRLVAVQYFVRIPYRKTPSVQRPCGRRRSDAPSRPERRGSMSIVPVAAQGGAIDIRTLDRPPTGVGWKPRSGFTVLMVSRVFDAYPRAHRATCDAASCQVEQEHANRISARPAAQR